uniref:Protein TIC 20 n=2 Tax=Cajanus cajan TaxID=3821 RepID=A0A151QVM9_CAJCA|nr:hypothetical protein KK1_044775 [Cajanus cajan]
MAQFPKLALLFEPILPFLAFYRSIPYSSFVAFFILYLGVVRNPSFPAATSGSTPCNIFLVIPLLFQCIFSIDTGPIMVFFSNAISSKALDGAKP